MRQHRMLKHENVFQFPLRYNAPNEDNIIGCVIQSIVCRMITNDTRLHGLKAISLVPSSIRTTTSWSICFVALFSKQQNVSLMRTADVSQNQLHHFEQLSGHHSPYPIVDGHVVFKCNCYKYYQKFWCRHTTLARAQALWIGIHFQHLFWHTFFRLLSVLRHQTIFGENWWKQNPANKIPICLIHKIPMKSSVDGTTSYWLSVFHRSQIMKIEW